MFTLLGSCVCFILKNNINWENANIPVDLKLMLQNVQSLRTLCKNVCEKCKFPCSSRNKATVCRCKAIYKCQQCENTVSVDHSKEFLESSENSVTIPSAETTWKCNNCNKFSKIDYLFAICKCKYRLHSVPTQRRIEASCEKCKFSFIVQ